MVSFIEIIKRLIPGDYDTMTGHPDAPERFKEFVEEVKSKIPELRGREDWDVESTVIEAVEWTIGKLCKPLRTREFTVPDYSEFAGLYECFHSDIGKFYLVLNEESDAASGYGYLGFSLTRNRDEARETYREFEEEIEEKERRAYGEEEEW